MTDTENIFPARVAYTGLDGRALVLVCDLYKGWKAYWIEDASGRRVVKPRFWRRGIIREITEA
jgi:hypothetical protein